jgi:hypothetical protein
MKTNRRLGGYEMTVVEVLTAEATVWSGAWDKNARKTLAVSRF